MQGSIEPRGLAHRSSMRNLQFHSAERLEQFMYCRSKIPVGRSVLVKGRPQDIPRFLFHGASVLGCTDAQPTL